MRLAFATIFLLLAACGQVPNDVVTVRAYTDAHGDPTPHADSLGFTYGPVDGDGAKYEEAGWNVLINPVLTNDPDDDRLTRVVLHELCNVLVLDDGDWPDAMDATWYLWEGDSQEPFHAIGPDEAAWFSVHGPYNVTVKDGWLLQPTLEAIGRINSAAGVEVFVL